eukprot:scaffold549_cov117-Isochrysis_galbana.AAC.15
MRSSRLTQNWTSAPLSGERSVNSCTGVSRSAPSDRQASSGARDGRWRNRAHAEASSSSAMASVGGARPTAPCKRRSTPTSPSGTARAIPANVALAAAMTTIPRVVRGDRLVEADALGLFLDICSKIDIPLTPQLGLAPSPGPAISGPATLSTPSSGSAGSRAGQGRHPQLWWWGAVWGRIE